MNATKGVSQLSKVEYSPPPSTRLMEWPMYEVILMYAAFIAQRQP